MIIAPRTPVDLVADLARDTGADPDELRVKFDLARHIAIEIEDRGITIGEAASLSGMDEQQVDRISNGRVGECYVWQLMRILAALGQDVAIEIVPSAKKGKVYVL